MRALGRRFLFALPVVAPAVAMASAPAKASEGDRLHALMAKILRAPPTFESFAKPFYVTHWRPAMSGRFVFIETDREWTKAEVAATLGIGGRIAEQERPGEAA